MDVLHIMKNDHENIRKLLLALMEADGARKRRESFEALNRELSILFSLERDYLYPELDGLFPGVDAVVSLAEAGAVTVDKRLKLLGKMLSKPVSEHRLFDSKVHELSESVDRHLRYKEDSLMLRIRQTFRTEEREDLGTLFLEMSEELRETPLPPVGRRVKAVSAKRRRA